MSTPPLAVIGGGIVSSVGLSAPAACAAIRAKLTNPTETRFVSSAGEWIMSHSVMLGEPLLGLGKLAHMGAMAVEECLANVPRDDWERIPLLLCVAEPSRPGRLEGLDDSLSEKICALLGDAKFATESSIVPHGRVSVAVALQQARRLLHDGSVPAVLILATDSLLIWPTLKVLEEQDRLLTKKNSNGIIPGEASSAVLVARPVADAHLSIGGLGFGHERATVNTDEPLRADGLTTAIAGALQEADCAMHDMDFRIADIAGEQYYFKEAALALSRMLRRRKAHVDIWHPAEFIGEVGSAIGPVMLVLADTASHKGYALGSTMLLHAALDSGERAAIVTRYLGHHE
jgi:3-oxoacyl-[acyl-carrier-protein] synthase-1